ncbi:MAG: hypothetical protein JWO55_846 [Candidatus Saccharibacteria bacterium]|jgi:hypothetical protein|nr:hypothetical protein [Candidatus Saccharibacteria bacterium]
MAEEKIDNSTPTNDDLNVLRVLLHSIKGISPVSTAASYMLVGDEVDPATEN